MAEKEYWRWKEYRWHDESKEWKGCETITAGVDVGSVSSQA
ncbi:benzoyl-CoA reductase, bzd-type, subunit Q, partial [bacterium]|nr:benzoyl-CoA reductase, bzd-type, subunit Q [bacterium]